MMHRLSLALLLAPLALLCAPSPASARTPALAPAPAQGSTQAEPAVGDPAETTLLRLYDGGILWGSIESHDAERVSFRRIDTGGLVRLEWSRLDPVQAEDLLQRFGYLDDSSEELMTEADRLVLQDGTELVGKIVNRTDEAIWLKTANKTMPVPKLRLRAGATVVQVPALDVYTREELYRQERANLEPDDPASHLELALFCERIFAFDEGLEHLARIAELDPDASSGIEPEVLANHVQRFEQKRANQEQIEVLREIDRLRARGKFDQALLLAETFGERFPGSPLGPDALRKQRLVERSLEKALRDRVASLWHYAARKLVRQKAMDRELSFDAAISWVDEALSEEILTRVHAELTKTVSASLEPEDVRRYFDARGRSLAEVHLRRGHLAAGRGRRAGRARGDRDGVGGREERARRRARAHGRAHPPLPQEPGGGAPRQERGLRSRRGRGAGVLGHLVLQRAHQLAAGLLRRERRRHAAARAHLPQLHAVRRAGGARGDQYGLGALEHRPRRPGQQPR